MAAGGRQAASSPQLTVNWLSFKNSKIQENHFNRQHIKIFTSHKKARNMKAINCGTSLWPGVFPMCPQIYIKRKQNLYIYICIHLEKNCRFFERCFLGLVKIRFTSNKIVYTSRCFIFQFAVTLKFRISLSVQIAIFFVFDHKN